MSQLLPHSNGSDAPACSASSNGSDAPFSAARSSHHTCDQAHPRQRWVPPETSQSDNRHSLRFPSCCAAALSSCWATRCLGFELFLEATCRLERETAGVDGWKRLRSERPGWGWPTTASPIRAQDASIAATASNAFAPAVSVSRCTTADGARVLRAGGRHGALRPGRERQAGCGQRSRVHVFGQRHELRGVWCTPGSGRSS